MTTRRRELDYRLLDDDAAVLDALYAALLDGGAGLPVPFAHVAAAQAQAAGNDDLAELGAGGIPATPDEALARARTWSRTDVDVGVGYCLRTIRSLYLVAALYPDAETAGEEAEQLHRTSNAGAIPRGVPIWWRNGRYGHVAISAGGGQCWSTDYRRPGRIDLAPIAALAPWCGGQLVGWSEDINGVDVWDATPTPQPEPRFDLDNRINYVTRALDRARRNDAPAHRIDGLTRWLDQLKAHRAQLDRMTR